MSNATFPKSVLIGGMDRSGLLKSLHENKVGLNPAAEALFNDPRFTTLPRITNVEIACLSVGELGFAEGATYAQMIAGARNLDLVECPLELGPHLRLQFMGQPEGSVGFPATNNQAPPGSITVASPPLDDRDETPKGFYLRCIQGMLWLRGYWSSFDNLWRPEDILVFARNKMVLPESANPAFYAV